jgi:hypothetical protein
MADAESELELVRRAKESLHVRVGDWPELAGIGISQVRGQYAIKLNLRRALAPERARELPLEVEGVPVLTEIVGEIWRRGSSSNPD